MITFELLYAMLLGLPSSYLDHLENEWSTLGGNIHEALRAGHDPLSALKVALQAAPYWQICSLRDSFKMIKRVLALPGLTYRQRELLLALRSAKVASLAQLSRSVNADRNNTFRRLNALVSKGLAVKFPRPDGVYYFPVPARLQSSARASVHRMMLEVMDYILADTQDKLHSLAKFQPSLALAASTTSTTPTTRTT
jgi:hypothetical protein